MFALVTFFRLPVSEERIPLSKKLLCLHNHKHHLQLMEQMQLLIFPSTFGGHSLTNSKYLLYGKFKVLYSMYSNFEMENFST